MGKILSSRALLIVMTIVTISCTKSNDLDTLFGKRVRFETNIVTTDLAVRVADNVWEAQDAIGVYVFEEESENVVERLKNVEYITKTGGISGSFVAKDRNICFPDNGDRVRFMSYYPYNSQTTSNIYKIDVSNQSNQAAIDLLYSFDKEAVYDGTVLNKAIPLNFDHKLAKIVINIKVGDGLKGTDLENLKIFLSGLDTKADFDLIEGKLSNRTAITEITPFKQLTAQDGFNVGYEAIVIPTDGKPKDAKIVLGLKNVSEVDINSDSFSWAFDNVLLGSYKYTYNIIIKRSEIIVLGLIDDWSKGEEDISVQ